jgi:hypothetical protein
MLLLVKSLNETLPQLEEEAELFQHSTDLQFDLQDLYDIYMDYCIECIQYLKRGPTGERLPDYIYIWANIYHSQPITFDHF